MKKLLFAIAAVIAIGFTACTNKTQAPAETTEAEEVATFNVDDEAAASINALSEQIQAQDADKFKQVLEGIQEKIKGIIANNPEIAKEYIIKIQDFLKENADKIKSFVGDNETVNNTLNALTSVSADDIVSSLNSAVESISNATEDACRKGRRCQEEPQGQG